MLAADTRTVLICKRATAALMQAIGGLQASLHVRLALAKLRRCLQSWLSERARQMGQQLKIW